MFFNSYTYIIFLIIVYFLYRNLVHRHQNYMLLIASYVFYGFWSVNFLGLILISTIVDFYCGDAIFRSNDKNKRKVILIVSICTNLGLLGVFKYYDFFITSFVKMCAVFFHFKVSAPLLQVVLPVGISFYTFQTMTYTIDIYRGNLKPTEKFFDFALFVSFFPQLVAGPIERAGNLLPQLTKKRNITWEQTKQGLWLILFGLYKKAVIADNLAPIADRVFNNPDQFSGLYVLIGIYAFTFQIYCDFSGYTDIARGTAKLMGIDLMLNFRQPYFATNPRDFWRRWHISLSTWFRDYLYIPLGGNRKGNVYRNLMITMVLCGLWHGAALNFIAWGIYHGILMAIYRRFNNVWMSISNLFGKNKRAWCFFRVFIMFHLTCIGWVLFREGIRDIHTMFFSLFGSHTGSHPLTAPEAKNILLLVFMVSPLVLMQFIKEYSNDILYIHKAPYWVRANAVAYCILMLLFWSSHNNVPFIYFQF